MKAVFLDRDGTINEDIGYLYSPEGIELIPGAIEGLKMLQSAGFDLFIITNQPGIGRNIFTREQYEYFTGFYREMLSREGIAIRETFCCPHPKEQNCVCRKPSAYFIEKAVRKYPIRADSSFAVGDHPHDIEMGKKAGVKTAYLLSGHGRKHFKELISSPDFISENLYEAASAIVRGK